MSTLFYILIGGAALIVAGLLSFVFGVSLFIAALAVWPATLLLVVLGGFVGGALGAIIGLFLGSLIGLVALNRS